MKANAKPLFGRVSDLDLRLLRVFKCVVDCGGMAAAELELNIGISTISRHIKDLEERLQLNLCRRGRSGFALTAEGERVYQETLRLLASTEEFRSSIDDIHQRLGGELHLAVFDKTATNPESRISKAIALFMDRAPGVRLVLHVAGINTIERAVMDGQFQIGIIPAHRDSESLLYHDLFGEIMYLYCGAGHPLFDADHRGLDWNDLRSHRFAGLGYHSPNMEISHRMRMPSAALGFDQESIATLILSGKFLGFLPDHYACHFQAAHLIKPVRQELFQYRVRFVAITRRSPRPGRATLIFQECLLNAHKDTRLTGRPRENLQHREILASTGN